MRFFDTHTHVQMEDFNADRDKILQRARESGTWMINVGVDFDSSRRAIELAEAMDEGVLASIGLHPNDAPEEEFIIDNYRELDTEKVVGVGETGLDFYRLSKDPAVAEGERERQKNLFSEHIELAKELNKPLIIHTRDAMNDVILYLQEAAAITDRGLNGVMHCYSGNWQQAQKLIEMGYFISFAGIVTFTDQYDEVVKNLPPDKYLIETDAPSLTPVPLRGKRNEPSYVRYTAERIALLRGVSLEQIANETFENAQKLFGV